MMPTLPNLATGSEVWGLFHVEGRWRPGLLGRVARVTPSGYDVRGRHGGFRGRSECPLFDSEAAANTWASANPLILPGAPREYGNAR